MTPVVDAFMSGQRPRYIGPELRGPADADGFRVKVGRYGDRWYHDPLPGDHIAPACETVWPSISFIKKASGNDWSFVALKRVADALETDKYRNLSRWPYADRYEALKAINKVGLNAAGQRGTNIHLMFDAKLHGQPSPITEGMPGYEYAGAVQQFFDQYNPTLVAAEFVCINRTLNGVGYGGTGDAIIELDGKRYIVDWKSRGADSEHGAYPEEAAQVSGYWGADYIIVEGRDGPERRLMPTLDGGLIVSIKPDGCRVYPIDLDKGFAHWSALHAWWKARQDEREPVGRQWPARKTNGNPQVEGEVISPQPPQSPAAATPGKAGPADPAPPPGGTEEFEIDDHLHPIDDQDNWHIHNAEVDRAEALAWASQPAPDPLPPLPTEPDEGGDLAWGWDSLKKAYGLLPVTDRAWISRLVSEAQRANVGFHSQSRHTVRRFHIISGLIYLAQHGSPDDDVLRALCVAALHNDAPLDPRHTPGACVGSLGAAEAQRFAAFVEELIYPQPT